MSDILIGVIVFGLVFGAAIFGMFLGRNLRVLEQKVNASDPPSPRLRRAKQTERSRQVRPATVHHPLLRLTHHFQHPIQEQGRPVPNQRSGQAERLRLYPQSAILLRRIHDSSGMLAQRASMHRAMKLVNITEDVWKLAAEHGITGEAAIEAGLREKATEPKESGAGAYAKA
jgi:hypothetical protein